jgi:hypothetical protein
MLTLISASRRSAIGIKPQLEALETRNLMTVDVILEWNDILLEANANDHSLTSPEQGGPILTARAFAIVSAAMYDAYNSINKIGESYLVTAPRAKHADSDAAVAQAAHDTLIALYPSQQDLFDSALVETLARIRDGKREDQGTAVGTFVAQQLLAARANDGAAELANNTYVPNGLPGFHAVDPLHPNQGFYASSAMDIAPFAVTSADQFAARKLDDGTPEGRAAFLASDEYTQAYNEVLALGGDGGIASPTERTTEQTEIGIYWAYDGRPGLGTPPRLYNQIVRTLAMQEGNSEAENARLFALVNIAMSDAGCTAWNNKYDDAFWRPIMGIRNGENDGNPETVGFANWTPLGAPASNPRPGETNFTPSFPAYTSGHATFGAATFQILTRFYGRDDISFSFTSDELNGITLDANGDVRPVVTRSFDSFTEAKLENAQSRIYLGIHWAFDRDDGIRTGDQAANYVYENILQPERGHGHSGNHVPNCQPDSNPRDPHENKGSGNHDTWASPINTSAGKALPTWATGISSDGPKTTFSRMGTQRSVDHIMAEFGKGNDGSDTVAILSAIKTDQANLGHSMQTNIHSRV